MRVLILNTDYEAFLLDLYAASPGLGDRSYADQMAARNQSLFGVADFYSRGFKANGVEAAELHLNNRAMQLRWATEQGLPISEKDGGGAAGRGLLSVAKRLLGRRHEQTPEVTAIPTWARDVLSAQIEQFCPDVILNQVVGFISARSLRMLAGKKCLLAGQIASPWHHPEDDREYDLIVSSLPNFVSRFEKRGIRSRLNRLAFSPSVLAAVPAAERDLAVTFVGSLSVYHMERIRLLEFLASRVDLNIWGIIDAEVPANSPLRACYRGHAWGRDMFAIFRRSKVVINQHIGIAGEYAANMRLYEATGCGAALVTDRKINLHELFDVGREAADYYTPDECLTQIEDLLSDSGRCANIGQAGQARTCREHTYMRRAAELAAIFADASV